MPYVKNIRRAVNGAFCISTISKSVVEVWDARTAVGGIFQRDMNFCSGSGTIAVVLLEIVVLRYCSGIIRDNGTIAEVVALL